MPQNREYTKRPFKFYVAFGYAETRPQHHQPLRFVTSKRNHSFCFHIEEGIAQDSSVDDEPPTPIDSEELKRRVAEINRENRSKEKFKAIKTIEEKHQPKLQEYENKLKSAYWQRKLFKDRETCTKNQFFTHYDFCPNPTDYFTFIPFNIGFESCYGFYPKNRKSYSGK